jgi:ubiquinone/menaquinone biosynthesis C-methylase UbiE
MGDYRAKSAYQNEDAASKYDQIRFTSIRGQLGHYLDRRSLKRALACISSGAVRNLIDIPCGTSRISKELIELGYDIYGSDVSFEMMESGKIKVIQHNNYFGFTQCDASQTAFQENSFDCLVCVRFIGHIPKDYRAPIFSEFRRISNYIIIELSLESNIVKFRKRIDKLINSGNQLPSRWDWEVFDTAGLEQELAGSGLTIINKWPKFRFLSDSWFLLLGRK